MDPVFPFMSNNISSTTTIPTTTPKSGDSTPDYVGFICAVVAVVLYGSNFVPVKKYKTGDGMFFQWILCSGIFLSGLILQMINNSKLYVMPMLGGVIWAVGNLCVVPIIKTIGMGLGLSIWGTCALCIGWAIGKFGLFGTKAASISHHLMNDFSVVLAFVSILILLMVKNEVSSSNMEIEISTQEDSPLITNEYSRLRDEVEFDVSINRSQSSLDHSSSNADVLVFKSEDPENRRRGSKQAKSGDDEDESSFMDNLSPNKKRLLGSALSVFSGLLYGSNFTPTLYVQNNYKNASQNGLDYVFAQFCGIYLASTVFFIVYCIFRKNRPKVYPEVIVPGLSSGVLWAIATGCWNIANSVLSQAVSFPIVATGPSGLASLFWGVLIFREIKGCKNISILILAFLTNLTGSLLAAFSK